MGNLDATEQIEYDDNKMKTKLILIRSGGIFGFLMFDDKSIFNTFLDFTA